jgi:uncharacterized membrane protein
VGLGAAAKLYPAILAVPFIVERFRQRDPDGGIHLGWAALGAWLLVNVPFAVAAPTAWWEFFRFNSVRPADWDSLWFIGCHQLSRQLYCRPTGAISLGSSLLFVLSVAVLWSLKARREPDFARWTLGFPVLVLFLLSNKVYSPQYGLWLLPWFALTLPQLVPFAAFSVADAAVFVTRFSWFGQYSGIGGLPIETFERAVIIRAVVLIWCLVAWIRRPQPGLERAGPEPVVEDIVVA